MFNLKSKIIYPIIVSCISLYALINHTAYASNSYIDLAYLDHENSIDKKHNNVNLAVNQDQLALSLKNLSNQGLLQNENYALKCPQDKHYKVAIIQSGHFRDFNLIFNNILSNLIDKKLHHPLVKYEDSYIFDLKNPNKSLVKSTYPIVFNLDDFRFDDPNALFLIQRYSKGSCLEFSQANFYNINWESYQVLDIKEQVKNKISNKQIDMIFAFGTEAGLYFADSKLNIPVFVIDASTPEKAGIIGSGKYSNKPNVYVQKDLERYISEIIMFHNLFKFKNLGILLDQNKVNRTAQAYEEILKISNKLNFNLVPCYGDIMGRNEQHAQKDFSQCLQKLSNSDIDAMFLTVGYRPEHSIYKDLKPLIDQRIPIYSQFGEEDVQEGALMCLSDTDKKHSANILVDVIEKYLHGQTLDTIDQNINIPLTLAINLKTAHLIEWLPSFELLLATDKVYQTIEQGKQAKEKSQD